MLFTYIKHIQLLKGNLKDVRVTLLKYTSRIQTNQVHLHTKWLKCAHSRSKYTIPPLWDIVSKTVPSDALLLRYVLSLLCNIMYGVRTYMSYIYNIRNKSVTDIVIPQIIAA